MNTTSGKIARIRLMASREFDLELVNEKDSAREEAEAFAKKCYRDSYGAEIKTFCHELLVLRASSGEIVSCVGINMAGESDLFLEQYLDTPVEQQIAAKLKRPVDRSKIAEIGTLATGHNGLCRLTMVGLAGLLKSRGIEHVAFTGIKSVRNALEHLGIPLHFLTTAKADRLKGGVGEWGSYYDAAPEVVFSCVAVGCRQIGRAICQLNNELTGATAKLMKGILTRGISLEKKGGHNVAIAG